MLNTFKKTYTLPFKYDIPNYTQKYLETTSFLKRFTKFFRRYLYIFFNSHLSLEQDKIKKEQKNILWINLSAPSLGDSLMDLSSRILLEDKNIDLFTDAKNAHIYKSDKFFNNVITDTVNIHKKKYDLVIIDSYGTKSLKTKFTYLETLPYVGIYGYYNGPEVNRVLYSFHRMNQLLGYIKTEDAINDTAKSIMYISHKEERIIDNIDLPNSFITIAIGGEWDYRTYNNWDKVISSILNINPKQNIILIGSQNAENEAEKLLRKFRNFDIISVIAKYSFEQTAQIIKKSDLLLCCDGGLMHAANGVDTTIIPLFAHLTPKMQLTNAIKAYSMYDKTNVNNIKVDEVIKNYKKYLEEK
ncbi:MAG: hypothetical protein KAQ94_02090 [Arcobacteraceae bacterium]|nr:hypothetical protein [Arcobacteraceae bacterium]